MLILSCFQVIINYHHSVDSKAIVNSNVLNSQILIEHINGLEEKIQQLQNKISDSPKESYEKTNHLPIDERKRILITGGAGFVGSHLCDKLMKQGHEVTVVDNFFTGRKKNVAHWLGHENFELIHHDVVNSLYIEVDQIYHLASPASPPRYMFNPVKTLKTNTLGTINMLGRALRCAPIGRKVLPFYYSISF